MKELSLSFPKLKTELKNSYWFVFYCCFCLARSLKKWLIVLGHIALFQLILKIVSWNSPDKLILILWFQIWNHIFNIKSLWRHYDVILKKLVKRQASSAKIDIYIDSVSQITLFLVGITNIPYFFLIWVKKQNISIYSWKMGPYLLGKRTSCWWHHETMGHIYYVEFNFLNIKFYVFKMFLPNFNRIEWKIEKWQLFQNRLFLALFTLTWGKDDVIVMSLLIWFGFSLS